jgi:hypothetical protein
MSLCAQTSGSKPQCDAGGESHLEIFHPLLAPQSSSQRGECISCLVWLNSAVGDHTVHIRGGQMKGCRKGSKNLHPSTLSLPHLLGPTKRVKRVMTLLQGHKQRSSALPHDFPGKTCWRAERMCFAKQCVLCSDLFRCVVINGI